MKPIILIISSLFAYMLAAQALSQELEASKSIEITPADYGKFGMTPFVGPVSTDGTQQTTLVFNKSIHGREITQVELLFFSSKKNLILVSENHFECKQEKCFITFGIIPDYQFNIEFDFVYGDETNQQTGKKSVRYRIKDIGALTGRFNRER